MVARLARLRITQLLNSFRGSPASVTRRILAALLLCGGAILLAVLPAQLIADVRLAQALTVLLGTAFMLIAFTAPFFLSSQAQHFASYKIFGFGSSSFALAFLFTGIFTRHFLLFALWLAALFISNPSLLGAGGTGILAVFGCLILLLLLVRVSALLAEATLYGRGAGISRFAGGLLLFAFLPLALVALTQLFTPAGAAAFLEAEKIVAYTPFGAAFHALYQEQGAAGYLALISVYAGIVILFAAYLLLARKVFTTIPKPVNPAIARSGLGWFERFRPRPASVIAARQLSYWARDPRYRVGLIAAPLAPVMLVVAFLLAGVDSRLTTLAPLPVLLLLFGWSLHNDIALDSTAVWTHIASGVKGVADRAGRLAPVLLVGVPLTVLGSSLSVAVLQDWRQLPAVLGLNMAVLLVATAVASVFSALLPYPATRPGESPFMQPQWSGAGAGFAQVLSILCSLLLIAPIAYLTGIAVWQTDFGLHVLALTVGVLYGVFCLLLGVWLGGRIFDRAGPELLMTVQTFD